MDNDVYLVGVDDLDCDVECDTHGDLEQTSIVLTVQGQHYVPEEDQCVHYCEPCLRQMLTEMDVTQVTLEEVLTFLLVNEWSHMEQYFDGFDSSAKAHSKAFTRFGSTFHNADVLRTRQGTLGVDVIGGGDK